MFMNEPSATLEPPSLRLYSPEEGALPGAVIPTEGIPENLTAPRETPRADPFDPQAAARVSALDELSLWSAPSGLKLLELVRLGRGLRVLDVGSGLGFPLLELAMRLDAESEAHGLDPWVEASRRAWFKARQNGLRNVFFHTGYAEEMPFPDASFDRVVSNNGFNNVRDLELAFAETARVAKPGAQLVFTVNLEGSFAEAHQALRHVLRQAGMAGAIGGLEDLIRLRRRPLGETLECVRAAGFRVEQVAHDSFAYRFADGSAMLRHAFFRNYQVPAWRELAPVALRDRMLAEFEAWLNHMARELGELRLSVPFATVSAVRA